MVKKCIACQQGLPCSEHPLAGIDSLMDGKDRDFRVEGNFNNLPKGDIEVHCACCQRSTAPTGNPEDGWFDFVEDGKLKRRLADGAVVDRNRQADDVTE